MTVSADSIRAGDPRALARAASAVENRASWADELLRDLFPHTGNALILGVTGPPGAGKSTLTSALIRNLRAEGRSVAVIAVDPSSPFSGGAILGDRIRMQEHHADPGVFIRSMATRGALGGLAATTHDLALLFDASGRDAVLIETVGVGQDEVEIARVADCTAVVLVPGMGDDIQAIKAGILEIADIFVLNKADQPGIDRLEQDLRSGYDGGMPPMLRTVASEGTGVPEVLAAVRDFFQSGRSRRRAALQWEARLRELFRSRLMGLLNDDEVSRAAARVAAREIDPYSVVHDWLQRIPH